MTLTLTLLTLIFLFSLGLLYVGIMTAPAGYEDEGGFHAGDGDSEAAEADFDAIVAGQVKTVSVYAKVTDQRMTA